MCMYTNRRHMAFVSHPCLVTISLSCWGKLCHLPPEPKNICWLLLWLVEDHTRTRNNIQNDVHTLMKQSYHVPIIGHFHFKLEKKFPQGAKKKYPCIEIIYDFSCQKYSKLRGKNVGIDLNLVF